MRRRAITAILAVSSATAVLSACAAAPAGPNVVNAANQSTLTPRAELTSAIRALNQQNALTTTYSLATTPAELTRIASLGANPRTVTPAQASAVAGGRITVEEVAPLGKTLAQIKSDPTAATESLTVTSGSTTYFSMLSVDGSLYLRVDLKDLADLTGDSAAYATLAAKAANYGSFIRALVGGQWVALPVAMLNGIQSLTNGVLGVNVPSATDFRSAQRLIRAAVYRDVRVTRPSTGTTDHLVIRGRVRPLAQEVRSILTSQLPGLRSVFPHRSRPAPRKVFVANAYVTGGALSTVSLDLGQFDKTDNFSLPVQAAYSSGGAPITAPSGAVALSLAGLGSLVGSLPGAAAGLLGSA